VADGEGASVVSRNLGSSRQVEGWSRATTPSQLSHYIHEELRNMYERISLPEGIR
jgi:hypothetical protein